MWKCGDSTERKWEHRRNEQLDHDCRSPDEGYWGGKDPVHCHSSLASLLGRKIASSLLHLWQGSFSYLDEDKLLQEFRVGELGRLFLQIQGPLGWDQIVPVKPRLHGGGAPLATERRSPRLPLGNLPFRTELLHLQVRDTESAGGCLCFPWVPPTPSPCFYGNPFMLLSSLLLLDCLPALPGVLGKGANYLAINTSQNELLGPQTWLFFFSLCSGLGSREWVASTQQSIIIFAMFFRPLMGSAVFTFLLLTGGVGTRKQWHYGTSVKRQAQC